MSQKVKRGMAEVNGARLYYEMRGSGPPLLFIPGADGDAEVFSRPAELLKEEFTVLNYDRRGYSRSLRPDHYAGTTVIEHADDAAALLEVLDLAPATVWGNSSGAIIALSLVLRHPQSVTRAFLHEPPLAAGMRDHSATESFLLEATKNGKIPFLKMLMGESLYEGLPADYRGRLEADDTWIRYEFGNFESYRPSDEELAGAERPLVVLHGVETLPFFGEVCDWLGSRANCEVVELPGNHAIHYERPDEVAKTIRRFVAREQREQRD